LICNETLNIKVYHHFFHTTCPHFQMKAYMMFLMASCVAYRWPLNTQLVKCVLDASNPCPHSHMKRLYADGCIKLRWKCNVEGKVKCAMWNEWINGLTINHSPTSLPEQKQMWALDDKENGIIFQSTFKRHVVMDVHQRCL
jgi:hypothetical protein